VSWPCDRAGLRSNSDLPLPCCCCASRSWTLPTAGFIINLWNVWLREPTWKPRPRAYPWDLTAGVRTMHGPLATWCERCPTHRPQVPPISLHNWPAWNESLTEATVPQASREDSPLKERCFVFRAYRVLIERSERTLVRPTAFFSRFSPLSICR